MARDFGICKRWNLIAVFVILKNTNINFLGATNGYVFWLTYNLGCYSGPITLTNVYAQEPDGTLSINSVWPDTNQPCCCVSAWNGSTQQSKGQLSLCTLVNCRLDKYLCIKTTFLSEPRGHQASYKARKTAAAHAGANTTTSFL